MLSDKLVQFPHFPHNPLPPTNAAFVPGNMPYVVPFWWYQDTWRIPAVMRGWRPVPAIDRCADARKQMDKRARRIGLVQAADMAIGQMDLAA